MRAQLSGTSRVAGNHGRHNEYNGMQASIPRFEEDLTTTAIAANFTIARRQSLIVLARTG